MTFNKLRQHRVWWAVIAGAILTATPAGFAHADAPGPTDYSSVIVEVTTPESLPLAADVAITIEGHDSFLSVTVARGTTVKVPGYEGEEYLKIESDCTAYENQRSMSTWYNKERYGSNVRADVVDHDAAPEWLQIASDFRNLSCLLGGGEDLKYQPKLWRIDCVLGPIAVSTQYGASFQHKEHRTSNMQE